MRLEYRSESQVVNNIVTVNDVYNLTIINHSIMQMNEKYRCYIRLIYLVLSARNGLRENE
jgi:hypothetical protein